MDTSSFFTISIEAHALDLIEGQTTYRFYFNATDLTDVIHAVFDSNQDWLEVSKSTGFYNDTFGGVTVSDINLFMLGLVPEVAADGSGTIGIENNSPGDAVSTLERPSQPWFGCFAAESALDGEDFVIDRNRLIAMKQKAGKRQQPNRTRTSFHGLWRSRAVRCIKDTEE